MRALRFLQVILIVFVIAVSVTACKKDQSYTVKKADVLSDTSNNSQNFLAGRGSLQIIVGDSTYTFNAAVDSIAFINAHIDSNKYFGITAINKQHTMSFGISSPGYAAPQLANSIAGGQLLFSGKGAKQYTLSQTVGMGRFNQITLDDYLKDSLITRGSFDAVMVNKTGADSTIVKAKGYFVLQK